MSLFGALFSGVSGLNAQTQALATISDNISNVNTIGYKGSDVRFSTLVTQAASSTRYSPGGVISRPFQNIERQGLLQSSERPTDIAISGNGFFVVNDASTPSGNEFLFTRAGSFTVDQDGFLTNASGYYLYGWRTTVDGSFDLDNDGLADAAPPDPTDLNSLEAVNVRNIGGTVASTRNIELGLNLPATAIAGAAGNEATTVVSVVDSLGIRHDLTLAWNKTAANTWTVGSTATGGTAAPAVAGVTFNGDGTLATPATGELTLSISAWTSGASNSIITIDLGAANTATGVTQFSDTYSVGFINQDGVEFGNFTVGEVDNDGFVRALFDNGETRVLYRLPVATFINPNGLDARTGNVFIQSSDSGELLLNNSNVGGAGVITPSSLESSTSDLGTEFTNLIVTQRAYSANTKIITTADEMLDELIRIKR